MRRIWGLVACATTMASVLTCSSIAVAAPGDPLFVFAPGSVPPKSSQEPEVEKLEGPCGLALDSVGNLYVSDYYSGAVKVYGAGAVESQSSPPIARAKAFESPVGPCAAAVGPTGTLYVSAFHGPVRTFVASTFPPPTPSIFVSPATYTFTGTVDPGPSTGLARDSATGAIYVSRRTDVAVYDSSGAPVLDGGGQPLTIGAGALGDAYGLAVSRYPATAGYVYVADADDATVKVFDPATDPATPVETIDGGDIAAGGFDSLRDSAIAVDDVSGDVYVADAIGTRLTETPKSRIQVFDSSGVYKGQLKHDVVDGAPVGLAVDNSADPTQGRVYVTSGNTTGASVYVYAPSSAVMPADAALGLSDDVDAQALRATDSAGVADGGESHAEGAEARASAEIVQKGTLRLRVSGRLAPKRLPRRGDAPVSVSVGGEITTTNGEKPPQLRSMLIELNREGRLDMTGLPVCPYPAIQPASSGRALRSCRDALVGKGSFSLDVTLSGQEPYSTGGRLQVFNGRKGGKPVLFGHIYSERPFATSFVIVFSISKIGGGRYGTALSASLPKALGSWGNLTGIEMTLGRRYRHAGRARSYLSAGCPAPAGFPGALFPLARTSFGFAEGRKLNAVLTGECKVR